MPFERCVSGAQKTCGNSCADAARYVGRPWQSGNEISNLGMRLGSQNEISNLGMRLGPGIYLQL